MKSENSYVCLRCKGTQKVECPGCKGFGFIWPGKREERCLECQDGFIPCPSCTPAKILQIGVTSEPEDQLYLGLKEEIRKLPVAEAITDRVANVIGNLFYDATFNAAMRRVENESKRRKINRHDKLHVLKVATHSLKIFKLLCLGKTNISDSLYLVREGGSLVDSLAAVLIAAIAHDIRRDLPDHAKEGGIFSSNLAEVLRFFSDSDTARNKIMNIVETSIRGHSGDRKFWELEEGIVYVADALDNDKNRTQPNIEIPEALRSDPKPIEYFASKDIESVEVLDPRGNSLVQIEFHVRGNASFLKINGFLNKLRKAGFDKQIEGRDFFHVWAKKTEKLEIENWKTDCLSIWPFIEWKKLGGE